jgi:prepilin-type N-terminal cleavage/methylation domain-containing protein
MKILSIHTRLKGFTLIEILMVITIVGILTVSFIPRMKEVTDEVKVKAAAKKLIADIRYSQGVAMSRHTNTTVVFTPSGNGYSLFDNDTGKLLVDPFSRGNATVIFGNGNQFNGVSITSVNFNGTGTLRFDYQGNPQNGAGLVLLANGIVNFGCGAQTANVTVTAGTGQVAGS